MTYEQGFRDGLEAAAKVAFSHGCETVGCERCVGGAIAAAIRALVPARTEENDNG